MHPPANSIEGTIIVLVQWLKFGIETVGVVLVAIGVYVAITQPARILAARQHTEFTAIRLTLARYLALAREFELGAGILGTASDRAFTDRKVRVRKDFSRFLLRVWRFRD